MNPKPVRTPLETHAADTASRLALRKVFGAAPLRFTLGDGTELCAGPRPHVASVVFDDARALLDVARDPEMGFGEAYRPELVRTWRLYLAGSEAAFRTGSLQLFQVTFAGSASGGA